LDLNFHVLPERWMVSQSLGGLGASLEWWLEQAWVGNRKERFAALSREFSQTQPNGQLFFLPLTGGHDDPATTRQGGFVGLQLSHNRAAMARAIMESAAYELRWALAVAKAAGMPVERLWMVGGAANSVHWPAILAHVTGLPIRLPAYDNWPALGAALLAGLGVGLFQSVEAGLANFQKPFSDIEPDGRLMSLYTQNFEEYQAYCSWVRQSPDER
jgi:xylulokinase